MRVTRKKPSAGGSPQMHQPLRSALLDCPAPPGLMPTNCSPRWEERQTRAAQSTVAVTWHKCILLKESNTQPSETRPPLQSASLQCFPPKAFATQTSSARSLLWNVPLLGHAEATSLLTSTLKNNPTKQTARSSAGYAT